MIIKKDPDLIKAYLEDASGFTRGSAGVLVIPEDEQDIVTYFKQAAAQGQPVTLAGGRTGVTAGAIPTRGALMSLEKLNALGPIQSSGEQSIITLGPTIRLEQLKAKAEEHHLIYGPDPTERTGTLGGNAATNASGGQCFKYGPTRDHVVGLRMVLTTGDIVELCRGEHIARDDMLTVPLANRSGHLTFTRPRLPLLKVYKNSAGYFSKPNMDALDLFIGMDGTLGAITSLTVKLLPAPRGIFTLALFLKNLDQANVMADRIRRSAQGLSPIPGINPLSLELMDRHALALLRPSFANIPASAGSALLVEQDFPDDEARVLQQWSGFLHEAHIPDHMIWLADDRKSREQLRLFRHALPEAVNQVVRKRGFPKVGTDMAVPDEAFSAMLGTYHQGLEALGQDYLIFGHIGECHLHVNVLPRTQQEFDQAKQLYRTFAEKAVAYGGTISAEHGIGKLKHDFLKIMVGDQGLREMVRIKKIFDPALILNRGNIFPEQMLDELVQKEG